MRHGYCLLLDSQLSMVSFMIDSCPEKDVFSHSVPCHTHRSDRFHYLSVNLINSECMPISTSITTVLNIFSWY